MLRRLLAAAVVTAAVASARPAAADGLYFLEGLGASKYGDELGRSLGEDGIHIRAAIGYRAGHLAIEAYGQGEIPIGAEWEDAGVAARSQSPVPYPNPARTGDPGIFGIDVKVIQPLSAHWSTYARAGLSKMVLDSSDYAGRGLGATAGIQVAGKVPALGYLWWPLFFFNKGPKVHSALWFEASTSFHRLHADGAPSLDAKITGWTFGFSIGQDF